MRSHPTAGGAVTGLVALGLVLTGCGSDATPTASSASVSPSSSRSEPSGPSTSPAAPDPAGGNETIAGYIKATGITETPVRRGDPDTPTLDLPIPEGWEDAGDKAPPGSWGAMVYVGDRATAGDPPTIIAIMSKLTGAVDQAKIFEYAPGELKNLPGIDIMGEGPANPVSGFDAFQIGGTFVKNGATRMIAQKTIAIPAKDGNGLFVLQFNASGTEDQMNPLMDATSQIDERLVITP